MPPLTEEDKESLYAFHVKYPIKSNVQDTNQDIVN